MYGQSIGIQTENVKGLILLLKQGLPVSSFSRLSAILGVPEKSLATTVNIPQRTLTRRKKEGRLKTDESERVIQRDAHDFMSFSFLLVSCRDRRYIFSLVY